MRFHILRALVVKEVRRHVANKGGLVLCGLLIVAALLLTIFNPTKVADGAAGGDLIGGVHHCYIDYPVESKFIRELKSTVPANLSAQLVFRNLKPEEIDRPLVSSPGTGAIRLKEVRNDTGGVAQLVVDVWHPPGDPGAMAVYEQWFYRACHGLFSARLTAAPPTLRDDDLWPIEESFRQLHERGTSLVPKVTLQRNGLGAEPLDYRSAIATAMVVFALYFLCCYLLPTMNCEERERGVLLAQALSPASPMEIVAAKFLFYPMVGMGLAATLAGIYNPSVLGTLFFWLALIALASGFLGIGMTVSTLAKTQRSAFMGSMCYLLVVALFLFVCNQCAIPVLPMFAIETHGPKILHAAVTQKVEPFHWWSLLAAFGLGAGWMSLAAWLFRKRGWQ
jgi:hypothetical protein